MLFHLAPPTHGKAYHWLLHLLVVVPIERVWAWQRKIARRIDREVLKSIGETDVFLQALITVIKADIQIRGVERSVVEMVGRLNSLRKENGYPEVTRWMNYCLRLLRKTMNRSNLLLPPSTRASSCADIPLMSIIR